MTAMVLLLLLTVTPTQTPSPTATPTGTWWEVRCEPLPTRPTICEGYEAAHYSIDGEARIFKRYVTFVACGSGT